MRYDRGPIFLDAEGRTRLHCGLCNCVFEIPFRHRCEVNGYSERADRREATDQIIDDERAFHRKRACPECGALPPRFVGDQRMGIDGLLSLLGVGVVGLIGLATTTEYSSGSSVTLLLIIVLAMPLLHLIIHGVSAFCFGTNASLRSLKSTNSLKPVVIPDDTDGLPPRFRWPNRHLGLVCLLAAAAAPLAPLLYLESNRNRVNADGRPGMVAPGDRIKIPLERRLSSLGGAWGGTVQAEVENGPNSGSTMIHATVPSESAIDGRRFTTKDHEESFRPEVEITVPNDPALEGRTLVLEVRVLLVLAHVNGGVAKERLPEIRERVVIHVASKEDVRQYNALLIGSVTASFLLICIAGIWIWLCNLRLAKFPKPKIFITPKPPLEGSTKSTNAKSTVPQIAPSTDKPARVLRKESHKPPSAMKYADGPTHYVAEGRTRLDCGACGTVFDVPFRHHCKTRTVNPHAALQEVTDQIIDDEIAFHDFRACPECGAAPVNEVGSQRAFGELIIVLSCSGIAGCCGLAIVAGTDSQAMITFEVVMLVTVLSQLILHVFTAHYYAIRYPRNGTTSTDNLNPTILSSGNSGRPTPFRKQNRKVGMAMLVVAIGLGAISLGINLMPDSPLATTLSRIGSLFSVAFALAGGISLWLCDRRLAKSPTPKVYITNGPTEEHADKPNFSWKEYRTKQSPTA